MQKAGNTWVPDSDWYFGPYFANIGDVFEAVVLDTGLRNVKRWRTCVDGGAHVGSWSRALAHKFVSVYSFEPQRDNWRCLLKNTETCPNVKAFNWALGDVNGYRSMASGRNSGCWHIADGDDVLMVRLDDLSITDLDYLKLDVEGFEYFALKGGKDTIARDRPVIQIEEKKLPHSYDCPTARSLLQTWGYKQIDQYGKDVIFGPEA